MTALTTRFVGRPVSAAPDNRPAAHDKWALVDDLTCAAADFGLSHRSIAVLRSLLTFVPARDLPARLGQSIVFASNATLSTRLGGMPESTLRRHLAALVQAGVIARFDSPNRKRYAKKLGSGIACAFGFDLGPLAMLSADLRRAAERQEQRLEEHSLLRTRILCLRQNLLGTLIDQGIDPEAPHALSPLFAQARLLLRRKDNNEELRVLLEAFENASSSPVLSVSDSENERHQHKEKNINSDSEEDLSEAPCLERTLAHFPEYKKMFPDGASDWLDVTRQATSLVPMMGIDAPVYEVAKRYLGSHIAPIAVLCILERFEQINNPGGYLRHLTKQAKAGEFDLKCLLRTVNGIVS
ncbi:plasmid replication protein RepC [Donghicola sp. XS_ASV15]|uniref:plasmid replication protein RepC n=1 Tax=Donghicola sp. XS_ASV15 TaxID=3241295 RepID=UPI0035199E5D